MLYYIQYSYLRMIKTTTYFNITNIFHLTFKQHQEPQAALLSPANSAILLSILSIWFIPCCHQKGKEMKEVGTVRVKAIKAQCGPQSVWQNATRGPLSSYEKLRDTWTSWQLKQRRQVLIAPPRPYPLPLRLLILHSVLNPLQRLTSLRMNNECD